MTHDKREPLEENLHNTVIRGLAEILEKDKLTVRINPADSKQNGVVTGKKTYYPDVYTFKGNNVTQIFEVESVSTVNENSVEQWKLYSSGKAKFFLVVPRESLKLAKDLVKKHKINVDGYWTF